MATPGETSFIDQTTALFQDNVVPKLRWLDKNLELTIATSLIIVYTVVIGYLIASRAVGMTPRFGQTTVVGAFIWMVWLGASKAIRDDDHLRLTLIRSKLSRQVKYLVYWTEWILWVIIAVIVIQYSMPMVERSMRSGSTIGMTSIPEWLTVAAMPVGFALMLTRVAQQMVLITRRYRNGDDISVDIKMTRN